MPTPHILYEQLENAGYIEGTTVNEEAIKRATLDDIVDLVRESVELTSAQHVDHDRQSFAHSASLALGGGRLPCEELRCRIKRAQELIQFAALYSDRVYVHNFLADLASHPELAPLNDLRESLRNDLEVLSVFRPLVEAGIVIPVVPPETWCPHCFGKKIDAVKDFDQQILRGLTRAGEQLRARFLMEAKVNVNKSGRGCGLEVRAPEDLIEHGFHAIDYDHLDILKEVPEVRSLILRGRKVPLSRRQIEKVGIHKIETADILQNVLFELAVSQIFGTSFLTERPIHVKILQALTSDSKQDRRNAIIRKHLTTLVPFVRDLSAEELIKLREEEADSFTLFRSALNRTIDAATNTDQDLTERQARDLFGDELEPSLARLDLKLRTAHNSLVKKSRRKIASWVGAITFGFFSGLVPSGLEAAAKVLGLTKVLADVSESVMNSRRDEDAIRSEDLYFLWKVREVSR